MGVMADSPLSSVGISTMWDPVDGPERWVGVNGSNVDDLGLVGGGRAAWSESVVGPGFLALGVQTTLRVIRLPNTTKASPI